MFRKFHITYADTSTEVVTEVKQEAIFKEKEMFRRPQVTRRPEYKQVIIEIKLEVKKMLRCSENLRSHTDPSTEVILAVNPEVKKKLRWLESRGYLPE
jgi:hypothetical protein